MQKNESAISPVVGVMLMLVVTIIIAALVSAFAGGTVSGTDKTPTATILATYSQSNGMTISHNGGDAIPLSTTTILVHPGKEFGPDASRYSWEVNKSVITTNGGLNWTRAKAFLPGSTATITKDNLTYVQQRPDGTIGDADSVDYGFNKTANLGLSFELLFQDSGGKTIAKTTVKIAS
ncbi:MAG: type IV pilin N-terminal domain-containing protein [Methanoregulaceae archaeon]